MKRSVLVCVGLYALALLLIALWPTHVDSSFNVTDTFLGQWLQDLGLDGAQTYGLIEFSANVMLYLPLGVLGMLLLPRTRWFHVVVLAFAVSATFEIVQAVFRSGRTADPTDIVSNTLGAALGAGLVVLAKRRGPRDV